jgi:outer membrane lipopolysaccharide assembly protein LptE/RlpB
MMTTRAKALAAAAAVAVLLAAGGCGYRLRGTGNFLFVAQNIKTIAVPSFKNSTARYELDLKLTRAVVDELVTRGRVEVVTDQAKADAVLEGEVAVFDVRPIAFTSQRSSADRYLIQVVANIVVRNTRTKKVIFTNPSYPWQMEYEVPQGTDFESSETEALNKVAELFARALVSAILEGF